MLRPLSIALALAAVLGLFLLPKARAASLAALFGQTMLDVEVAPTPAQPGLAAEPLWKHILRSPAYSEPAPGRALLLLGNVRLECPGAPASEAEQASFEAALARGLRQKVAAERDRALELRRVEPEAGCRFRLLVQGEQGEQGLELLFGPAPGVEQRIPIASWRRAGPLSLLPPLIAIALAIGLRKPVLSLFAGVLSGALLLRWSSDAGLLEKTFGGLRDVVSIFLWREFSDQSRWKVIGFVVAMLAMVGVVTKNGGIRGLMQLVARRARSARTTQIAAFLMGLAVFFDDYANTILVGTTMRPLTDRFRVAREKLAYIVDSTAAPVAGISIFSTWIAFEVSTFSAQLPLAGLEASDGYQVFIETLPYRFYCLLTLGMVLMVVVSGRDFGPMLRAERRARTTGQLVRQGGTPMVADSATAMQSAEGISIRAWRALVPLGVFIGVTLWTILATGGAFERDAPSWYRFAGLSAILGAADSYEALWRGSLLGFATAVLASLQAGLRSEILEAAWRTLRSMGVALAILYLAWMIGAVCAELGTANYLTVMLDGVRFPLALPLILFALASAISFSTGSSWSTMSILLPLVVGLAFTLGERCVLGGHALMVLAIGAVLEGSIFGDHCSPISDTTVLSSVACASDHIDHVRTQAPYALLVMLVAIVAGYLPAAFLGWQPAWCLLLGLALIALCLRFVGERVEQAGAAALAGVGPGEGQA